MEKHKTMIRQDGQHMMLRTIGTYHNELHSHLGGKNVYWMKKVEDKGNNYVCRKYSRSRVRVFLAIFADETHFAMFTFVLANSNIDMFSQYEKFTTAH
jgi:hypothetical protein